MSLLSEREQLSPKEKLAKEIDSFPFKDLKISEDWKKLEKIEDRTACSICKRSRKYFCYTCHVPVPEVKDFVPTVKLPVKVDIIKHVKEMDGKSTAVHAAVLAPEDVRIFTYPCMPDYPPDENVVLIYPNKKAVSVEEMCETLFRKVQDEPQSKRPCLERRDGVVHRAVFIDSTWNQSRGIFKDTRIKSLPSVVLKSRLSQFWRHQPDSPRWYLATVEAIHQFLVELDGAEARLQQKTSSSDSSEVNDGQGSLTTTAEETSVSKDSNVEDKLRIPVLDCYSLLKDKDIICHESDKRSDYPYDGKYDNLLFFFRFMYSKIHSLYDHDQLRSYKRRLE